jgi:hypothetical protein
MHHKVIRVAPDHTQHCTTHIAGTCARAKKGGGEGEGATKHTSIQLVGEPCVVGLPSLEDPLPSIQALSLRSCGQLHHSWLRTQFQHLPERTTIAWALCGLDISSPVHHTPPPLGNTAACGADSSGQTCCTHPQPLLIPPKAQAHSVFWGRGEGLPPPPQHIMFQDTHVLPDSESWVPQYAARIVGSCAQTLLQNSGWPCTPPPPHTHTQNVTGVTAQLYPVSLFTPTAPPSLQYPSCAHLLLGLQSWAPQYDARRVGSCAQISPRSISWPCARDTYAG